MSHTAPIEDQAGAASVVPADRLRAAAREIHEGGVNTVVAIVRRNQVLSLAGASTLMLFIAGLGPQIRDTDHIGFDSINVATLQVHPAVPGWVYLLLALAAATGSSSAAPSSPTASPSTSECLVP